MRASMCQSRRMRWYSVQRRLLENCFGVTACGAGVVSGICRSNEELGTVLIGHEGRVCVSSAFGLVECVDFWLPSIPVRLAASAGWTEFGAGRTTSASGARRRARVVRTAARPR